MAKDREIELKLALDPADAAAFRRHPMLRERTIAGPTRRRVFNVYFDTPGLALKHHAMALRLRKTGGKWRQTLKTAGATTGGLHQRGEWETPLAVPQLDLALFRDTPLATLAQAKALHLTLKPAFITDFQRTTWQVELAPGQRVEVALDQGVVRCGPHTSVISEVEIELLEGSVATVFDVAMAFAGTIAVRPDIVSKAERGYRLFHPEPSASPRPRRAAAIQLDRKWHPADAMQVIVAECLAHFESNVEGALTRGDPEYVHQLRVSLRRLRSAMRIFRPANAEHIAKELRWLTAALGDARDWDVLMTEILPALLKNTGNRKLATTLVAAATRRRETARHVARAALASARAARLVMTIGRWAGVPGEITLLPAKAANDGGAAPSRATSAMLSFASQEIHRRHRRLLNQRGHHKSALVELSAEDRHRVRIHTKRLRYAVDFFSSLYGKERLSRYVKVLGKIQDLLGQSNDDRVAMQLVESLAPPGPFSKFASAWFAARTRQSLAAGEHLFAEMKSIRRFWRE